MTNAPLSQTQVTPPAAPTAGPADVTVVVVSYHSARVLPGMLASVPEACTIHIVDNADKPDPALEPLAQAHGATILRLGYNGGFGRACNLGADAAKTRFVLFLNPDARLKDGAIEAFINGYDRYGPAVAFNPRIESSTGKPYFKRRSALLPKNAWLPRGWPEGDREVPVLSGAAIFTAKDECVPFDPNIFLFYEDDDWSLTMQAKGVTLRYLSSAHVVHDAGTGTDRNPASARIKGFHIARSFIYASRKHGRPMPYLRAMTKALAGLVSPENLFSARKRAKHWAFFKGVVTACFDGGKAQV